MIEVIGNNQPLPLHYKRGVKINIKLYKMQKEKLNKFLSEYPLYKEFIAIQDYSITCKGYTDPFDIHGETFNYYCEDEDDIKTFELTISNSSIDYWGAFPEGRIPKIVYNDKKEINYIEHFTGVCKSCNKYHVDFLLHIWSDKQIPENEILMLSHMINKSDEVIKKMTESDAKIFIEKVGIYPQRKITIDKELSKYFDRETSNWYFKALKSLNDGLGIGAFAYFRRIIEKELISIVNDLAHLNSGCSDKIQELLTKYSQNDKVYLLYENIFEYLPESLKILGDNPFQLLYKQTSEGLHSLTESECLKRADNINTLLRFVIRKINEEKSEILEIRNIIKDLKK